MRKWLALSLVAFALNLALPSASHAQSEATIAQTAPRIVMLLPANAFRDEEFEVPYKLFSSHATVTVTSTKLGALNGMMGLKARAEILIKDIDANELDGLVLIGGVGARQYWRDATVHRLIRDIVAKERVLAAISIAPVTLAYAGVLKGRRATVFVSERGRLIEKGAKYTGKELAKDGLIMTASGPKAALTFAEEVLRLVLEEHKKRQEAAIQAAALEETDAHGAEKAEGVASDDDKSKAVE